jgi:2',3'-cyclic-nucleotide 2'-phosphodiesterase (5'-nucleotidase family)
MSGEEGRCTAVDVDNVEATVASTWFVDLLKGANGTSADAVLVLAHMDYRHPSIVAIVNAMRQHLTRNIPILTIAGHSHIRASASIDSRAAVFEPGNYFNTVGVASFDLPAHASTSTSTDTSKSDAAAAVDFHFTHVDSNVERFAKELNATERSLSTASGKALSKDISAARTALNLSNVIGCSSSFYSPGSRMNSLYFQHVVPNSLFLPPNNTKQFFIQSTASLRYALYAGPVTIDDVFKILPFQDHFHTLRNFTTTQLRGLLNELNRREPPLRARRRFVATPPGEVAVTVTATGSPFYDYCPPLRNDSSSRRYDLLVAQFDLPFILKALVEIDEAGRTPLPYRSEENYTDTKMFIDWAQTYLKRPPCKK